MTMIRLTTQLLATMGFLLAGNEAFSPNAFLSRPAFVAHPLMAFSKTSSVTMYRTRLLDSPSTISEVESETKTEEAAQVKSKEEEEPTTSTHNTDMAGAPPSKTTDAASKPKPKPKKAPAHKEGVLSPLVAFMKEVMGDQKLNKLRGKVISVHSNVIGSFVDTSESAFGDAVLRALFSLADVNKDGTISKKELQTALQSLGFKWLQDKQIEGIFKRADADGNGRIDADEWVQEAPKTLRTNLIKLAKTNGGAMGLLA